MHLLQNIDSGYSLEQPRFKIYVLSKNKKKINQTFSAEHFQILKLKNLCLLQVFIMKRNASFHNEEKCKGEI